MSISPQRKITASKALWFGWFLMLIGLLLPVITFPTEDPHVGSLVMFLGLGSNAYGLDVALGLILAPVKHIGWLVFSIPIWLGLIAPVFLRVRSKAACFVLALIFCVGFIVPVQVLIFSLKAVGLMGVGFYIWLLALLILAVSRVTACLKP